MHKANRLVLVTTGLRLEDGGMASLARQIAKSMENYCRHRNMRFEVLDLGQPSDIMQGMNIHYFAGNQFALARSVWTRAVLSRKTAFVFIHIGPARTMGFLPRLLRPRYMIWLVGVEMWRSFSTDRHRAMQNATSRTAISAFTERRSREFHPWLPPVDVLLLALEDRPANGEIDYDLLRKLGEQTILIVGRLAADERYKGHDELLQTMPSVLKVCPSARLVITGKGDDLARLKSVASDLGITEQVIFAGFVNDATLQELYRHCRVFAMPSRYEGFGLVFLEAMKAARPCVALRDSAAAEIVQDGVTGLLVDYGDMDQLANALIQLLEDDAYSQHLGQAGYERWQQHFTYGTFYEHFQVLLDQLCRGTG